MAKVQGLQATVIVNNFVGIVASGDIGRFTIPGTNITLSIPPVVKGVEDEDEDDNESVIHKQALLVVSLVIVLLLIIASGSM